MATSRLFGRQNKFSDPRTQCNHRIPFILGKKRQTTGPGHFDNTGASDNAKVRLNRPSQWVRDHRSPKRGTHGGRQNLQCPLSTISQWQLYDARLRVFQRHPFRHGGRDLHSGQTLLIRIRSNDDFQPFHTASAKVEKIIHTTVHEKDSKTLCLTYWFFVYIAPCR